MVLPSMSYKDVSKRMRIEALRQEELDEGFEVKVKQHQPTQGGLANDEVCLHGDWCNFRHTVK